MGSKSENVAWDARLCEPITRRPHPCPHGGVYYAKCIVGGLLSCGLTHTAVVPLDVTKCKMQVFPQEYRSLTSGLRSIYAQQGVRGLTLGWFPTFVGYSFQGMFKFGLYEVFKDMYGNILGEERMARSKAPIWLAASASAELFADIALCPLEMVKVKMQTAPANVASSTFFQTLRSMQMNREATRFPFGSLRPLWSRQIPYTMAKFYFFERIVQWFYDNVFTQPKENYGKPTQLGITFTSGYIAGVVCAIVSHPADSLVSQMGKSDNQGKSFRQMASEMGMRNLMTKGLGTRVLMIGTLTGLQWWIYDTFKATMGMGTTGGGSRPSAAVQKQ